MARVNLEKANPRICIPEDADRTVRFAGRELQRYLKAVFGQTVPVTTRKPRETPGFFLSVSSPKKTPGPFNTALDAFTIRAAGTTAVTISGGSPRGLLYGVYALLEQIGCRFLSLAPDGEVVPARKRFSFSVIDTQEEPAFSVRGMMYLVPVRRYSVAFVDWAAKNRMNVLRVGSCSWPGTPKRVRDRFVKAIKDRGLVWAFGYHSFEYFLRRGRGEDKDISPVVEWKLPQGYYRWCPNDPRKVRELCDGIDRFIEEYPEVDMIDLWPNDGGMMAFCDCPKCVTMNVGGEWRDPGLEGVHPGGRKPWVSPQHVALIDRVARHMKRRHPDTLLDFLLYVNNTPRPRGYRPPKNTTASFAAFFRDYAQPVGKGSTRNRDFARHIRDWCSALSRDRLAVFEYYLTIAAAAGCPFYFSGTLGEDMRALERTGHASGVHSDQFVKGWRLRPLTFWLYGQYLWNPGQDDSRLLREFCRHYFGPAAAPMRKYFKVLEKRYAGIGHYCCLPDAVQRALTPAALRALKGLIEEAKALCGGDRSCARHVQHHALSVDFAERLIKVLNEADALEDAVRQGKRTGLTAWADRIEHMAEHAIALAKRHAAPPDYLFPITLFRKDDCLPRYLRDFIIKKRVRKLAAEGTSKPITDDAII